MIFFWFESDVISLYNKFKLEQKTDYEKIKFSEKNVQNFKNIVKGILWFCDKMPNKKPEDPTEVLAQKVSLLIT